MNQREKSPAAGALVNVTLVPDVAPFILSLKFVNLSAANPSTVISVLPSMVPPPTTFTTIYVRSPFLSAGSPAFALALSAGVW